MVSYRRVALAWAIALGISGVVARACDTPVFRYAMSNWAPAPYHVFYVYEGQPSEQDDVANRRLKTWSEGTENVPPANLLFQPVDRADAKRTEQLPGIVREACEAIEKGDLPRHLVYTPWGEPLSSQRLDEAAIEAMFHSPARDQLAAMLDQGKTAVLLMIPGADPAENDRVEKVVNGLLEDARAGRVTPGSLLDLPTVSPDDLNAAREAGNSAPGEGPSLELGLIRVNRQDPAEQWLVRSLTALESDLTEYVAQPMIYFVFGRGQAMPPYVGAGINAENLRAEVGFVCGPCSCTVKQENPGGDLPMQWDWDATAVKLDQRDLLAQEENVGAEMAFAGPAASAIETVVAAPPSVKVISPDANETAVSSQSPADRRTAMRTDASPTRPSFANRLMWVLGGGFALATLLVAVAGMVMVRRRPG